MSKNIEMNYFNGSGYDQLYPKSNMSNISDWNSYVYSKSEMDSSISGINSNISSINTKISNILTGNNTWTLFKNQTYSGSLQATFDGTKNPRGDVEEKVVISSGLSNITEDVFIKIKLNSFSAVAKASQMPNYFSAEVTCAVGGVNRTTSSIDNSGNWSSTYSDIRIMKDGTKITGRSDYFEDVLYFGSEAGGITIETVSNSNGVNYSRVYETSNPTSYSVKASLCVSVTGFNVFGTVDATYNYTVQIYKRQSLLQKPRS